jgi:high affinity cGMP-specific 3',5'-cyclic phosphodiesterase 9
MYSLIYLTDLTDTFDPLKILSLIVAAISHDLNHDGFNNAYQINASTPLAMIYNDQSPLEMYHCALAFSILTKERCNIIMSFNREMSKEFRENVIE